MKGWEKKGIVMLFLKYQPSLASGPAAALTAVQIQLQLLWTLPCLAQGQASPAHTSRGCQARDSLGTGHTTQQGQRHAAAIPVCGEIRVQGPKSTWDCQQGPRTCSMPDVNVPGHLEG